MSTSSEMKIDKNCILRIIALSSTGKTHRDIAKAEDISKTVVSAIVKIHNALIENQWDSVINMAGKNTYSTYVSRVINALNFPVPTDVQKKITDTRGAFLDKNRSLDRNRGCTPLTKIVGNTEASEPVSDREEAQEEYVYSPPAANNSEQLLQALLENNSLLQRTIEALNSILQVVDKTDAEMNANFDQMYRLVQKGFVDVKTSLRKGSRKE